MRKKRTYRLLENSGRIRKPKSSSQNNLSALQCLICHQTVLLFLFMLNRFTHKTTLDEILEGASCKTIVRKIPRSSYSCPQKIGFFPEREADRHVKTSQLAEGVGFEPTIRYNRIPDFESGAFDLSATLPKHGICRCERAAV